MIKEFAVDPRAVVRSFADFKYVIEKFGVPEGRIISEFPRKWRRMAYQEALRLHKGTAEYSKIEERLRKMPRGALLSLSRPGGDGAQDWLDSAIVEHGRQPFDYILSSASRDGVPIVQLDEFDSNHPCLEVGRDRKLRRVAAEMSTACEFLLRNSRHVKLIDPYFDFQHRRFVNPFLAFLAYVSSPSEVEVYRNDRVAPADLSRAADRYLPAHLPDGVCVRMFTMPEERMHNRYLLTELGGVRFGIGLDESLPGAVEEDDVSLVTHAMWESLWDEYANGYQVGDWKK
jgi:hypothetical protein